MSLVGLDIGTTGCKAVTINDYGLILAQAAREYPVITTEPGWAELDAAGVWNCVKAVLWDVGNKTRTDPVQALSVSAMGDTITACDRHVQPLYNSILAFDTRSTAEAIRLGEQFGREQLFQVTGMPLHPTYSASKILWLKTYLPEVFQQTAKFLCYEDFILAKLGAEPAISYSSAARTMLFDLHQNAWHPDLLAACGIQAKQLALPYPSGIVVGKIHPQLAAELQLPDNVQLVTGGHDQPCGALGCGVIADGLALDTAGTVEVLLVAFSRLRLRDSMLNANICCYPHTYPERYCSFAQIPTAGAALRWFRDQFGYEDRLEAQTRQVDVYDVLMSKFPQHPGKVFMIPHLAGSGTPEMNPSAKGCIYGLTLNTTKYELARAVLEGITHELNMNIQCVESAIGIKIDELRCVGGGAKSKIWLQLKADLTGRTIIASQFADVGALGAAVLAGYGIGTFATLAEGIQVVQSPTQTFYPNPEIHKVYQERFQIYLSVRKHISALDQLL